MHQFEAQRRQRPPGQCGDAAVATLNLLKGGSFAGVITADDERVLAILRRLASAGASRFTRPLPLPVAMGLVADVDDARQAKGLSTSAARRALLLELWRSPLGNHFRDQIGPLDEAVTELMTVGARRQKTGGSL